MTNEKYWSRFVNNLITNFRENIENRLAQEDLEMLKKESKEILRIKNMFLSEPCQIVVLDFVEPGPIGFVIKHDSNLPDRSIPFTSE